MNIKRLYIIITILVSVILLYVGWQQYRNFLQTPIIESSMTQDVVIQTTGSCSSTGCLCASNTNCSSGNCYAGICVAPEANCQPCGNDGNCSSGNCVNGICYITGCEYGMETCGNCFGGTNGSVCTTSTNCSSGNCFAGFCSCTSTGCPCASNTNCSSGNCYLGICSQ